MTAPTPDRRLAVFRTWFVACAALALYLAWVIGVEYRVQAHEPGFVLPNLAALLVWWGVFTRTCVAWQRVSGSVR
jgi:hypothetical protein